MSGQERFERLMSELRLEEDTALSLLLDVFGLWVMENDDDSWAKLIALEMSCDS